MVDTGSPIIFLPRSELLRVEPTAQVQPTRTSITSVSGHTLPVLGEADIKVKGESSGPAQLKMIVTQGGPPVLGLDGLRALDVRVVFNTAATTGASEDSQHLSKSITDLIKQCGTCTGGMKVKPVTLEVTCPPIFLKARPIAFNLRGAVEKNLQELVQAGVERSPSNMWPFQGYRKPISQTSCQHHPSGRRYVRRTFTSQGLLEVGPV